MVRSLTRLFIRSLEAFKAARHGAIPRGRRYRQETHSMGAPRVDPRKALAVAAALEDDEVVRKLSLGK
jgi:hypothetical protein